ncbi:MAG: hypothetical protein ACREA0_31435, partial [bacterium]
VMLPPDPVPDLVQHTGFRHPYQPPKVCLPSGFRGYYNLSKCLILGSGLLYIGPAYSQLTQDAEQVPYADSSFDVIVRSPPELVAAELLRVYRVGGRHGQLDARGSRRPNVLDHRQARPAAADGLTREMG